MTTSSEKPWAGRFTEPTDAFVEAFTASIDFDRRLYRQDIRGSIAHASMLAKAGILTAEEGELIINGLTKIQSEIEAGNIAWSTQLEDVHMNIESRLTDDIGDVGKKLHTGRSRNDQVATDIRLYLRDEIELIINEITRLQQALVQLAEQHVHTIMPGFTHLQTAQPISFAHHMMAWYEMLCRDKQRLEDCNKRVNVMPLGSAALAGTTYPIDRHFTAELLGFNGVCTNSLDAVSDRDFIIEFTSAASILMMHLSRYSEELIIWCSAQFNFVELGDSFCTGSSIMPQKKNPDVPELIRGKSARVFGHLTGLLCLMKAQPLAYNKDNQEDKEPLFDTVDTLRGSLKVFADMVPNIFVNKDNMYQATLKGYATATDLADYLVKHDVPFRDAHEIVGKAVKYAIDNDRDLSELKLEELRQFSDTINNDVFEVLSLEGSLAARNHVGGTAPDAVMQAIKTAREDLNR